MTSQFFRDKRSFVPNQRLDDKAEAVWAGLMKSYPEEVKEIQNLQKQDTLIHGKIMPATEAKINAFLDKVVEDNKKYGRT